ncbi:hypothetical protein GS415_10360 [Rhodococcus hoagii]|nr:hypothetical protein [Prescottella equi]
MNDPEQHFLPATRSRRHPSGPQMNPCPCARRSLAPLRARIPPRSRAGDEEVPAAIPGRSGHVQSGGKWVPLSTPDPEPVRIPDIHQLTADENEGNAPAVPGRRHDTGGAPRRQLAEIVEIKR